MYRKKRASFYRGEGNAREEKTGLPRLHKKSSPKGERKTTSGEKKKSGLIVNPAARSLREEDGKVLGRKDICPLNQRKKRPHLPEKGVH